MAGGGRVDDLQPLALVGRQRLVVGDLADDGRHLRAECPFQLFEGGVRVLHLKLNTNIKKTNKRRLRWGLTVSWRRAALMTSASTTPASVVRIRATPTVNGNAVPQCGPVLSTLKCWRGFRIRFGALSDVYA